MEKQLMVSVSMITYKHEAFIKQAVEGVLMQETNFEFDLIIADDCSPDNTESIVRAIILSHPRGHLVKYFRHETNIGMLPNGTFAGEQCKGKYIAICEGDDYWTDPLKLQKQVDFLEANPNITVSYHPIQVETSKSFIKKVYTPTHSRPKNGIFTFYDSLQGKNGSTLSMMFRIDCLKNVNYIGLLDNLTISDWPLECVCTLVGNGYVHDEIMGVYRIHEGGITNTFKKIDFYDSRIAFAKRLLHLKITASQKIFITHFIFRIIILKAFYLLENKHIIKSLKLFSNSIFYIRFKKRNTIYCWNEKYSLKKASLRFLKKVKHKLFVL